MLNRITWHHTGGNYKPNAVDLGAYHELIDGDGEAHAGRHEVLANASNASMAAGTYAAHTRALNRGNIGLSVCSMVGGTWSNPRASRAYPRPAQIDTLVQRTAHYCRFFGIDPTRRNVLSHAEVEPTLGIRQKNKWDFDYQIRSVEARDPIAIGDELRQEVKRLLGTSTFMPYTPVFTLRQGDRGLVVAALQEALGIKADGIFGPKTRASVAAFQRSRNLLPDGVAGDITMAALGL
jgi:hypothetical protein